MTLNEHIEKIEREFDEALYKENLRGSNPYFPNWIGVKAFWTSKLREIATATLAACEVNKTTANIPRSNCCHGFVQVSHGEEGTNFYLCMTCLKACDLESGKATVKGNENDSSVTVCPNRGFWPCKLVGCPYHDAAPDKLIEPESPAWSREFDEKFIPLVPGFSVMRDFFKPLPGVTANYETLRAFIASVERKAEERGRCDLVGAQRLMARAIDDLKDQARAEERRKIKADLLKIADQGEYEDLRREVEDYFAKDGEIG